MILTMSLFSGFLFFWMFYAVRRRIDRSVHNSIQAVILLYVLYIFGQTVFSFELGTSPKFSLLRYRVIIQSNVSYIISSYFVSKTIINNSLSKRYFIKLFDQDNSFQGAEGFTGLVIGNSFYTSSYYKGIEEDMNMQTWNQTGEILHFRDIFTTFSAALVTYNMTFMNLEKSQHFVRRNHDGPVIASFDHVIALGNTQLSYFSHFLYDFFMPLSLFPQELISKSFFTLNSKMFQCPEIYEMYGIKPWQIILLKMGEWVYARNLYTTYPQPHNKHYGKIVKILSDKLRKGYKIDHVIPTLYAVANRGKKEKRYISNLEEAFSTLCKTFPKINFTFMKDPRGIRDSALLWSRCKFILLPTGSNCVKHLFMKERSVMVVLLGDLMDNCIGLTAAAHEIYTLYFRVSSIPHDLIVSNNTVNIPLMIQAAKIGLYCCEHDRWDPNCDFVFHDPRNNSQN